MRNDAEPDVVSTVPQLDEIALDVLRAGDESALGQLLDHLINGSCQAEDSISAFANYI